MNITSTVNQVKINPISYCAIPIKMILQETDFCGAHGTAFIYEQNDALYLITNWHNVSGINPITSNPMLEETAFRPDAIRVRMQIDPKHTEYESIKWRNIDIKLYDEDGNPLWFISTKYRHNVDVIAIELKELPQDIRVAAINNIGFDNIKYEIADDIFVLGFPLKPEKLGFPIWKRGSIASEPDLNYLRLPLIMIDTSTYKGMSGSPVIFKRTGIHNLDGNGGVVDETIIGEICNFIGIYSGRLFCGEKISKELPLANLGLVWKKHIINEIINDAAKDKINTFDEENTLLIPLK